MTESLYRLQWRHSAREDLRKIIAFIGQDNPIRAASFGRELHSKSLALTAFPELGRKGRRGISEYRELVLHPSYILFYRIMVDAKLVQIVRIKHAARKL